MHKARFVVSFNYAGMEKRIVQMRKYIPAALIAMGAYLSAGSSPAAICYVWTNSPHPAPPYNAWSNAAHMIQVAVNHAVSGDTIWVTNGVYDSGGKVGPGALTNRVCIDKPIEVRACSPQSGTCLIRGAEHVRCCYVCDGARLTGFTLEGGNAFGSLTNDSQGGGALCESGAVISNCVFRNNHASRGGGAYGGQHHSCVFSGNRGGVARAYVRDSRIEGNSEGGAWECTLENCEVLSNNYYGVRDCRILSCCVAYNTDFRGGYGVLGGYVEDSLLHHNGESSYYAGPMQYGGGAYGSVLVRTRVEHNVACIGGGVYECILSNCCVVSNWASGGGGGGSSIMYNCLVAGNKAQYCGGGCDKCRLNNCTVVDNHADSWASGLVDCYASNTIVWGEKGIDSSFHSSHCNTNDPGLVNPWNPMLLASSPCIDAGSNQAWMAEATDLAGNLRINGTRVDIGAFEFWPQNRTGDLAVTVSCTPPAAVTGVEFCLKAEVMGNPLDCTWNWEDGTVVTGQMKVTHAYLATGVYHAVFRAWNYDTAVTATVPVCVYGPDIFVAASGDDKNDGESWQYPKKTIQGAIDGMWPGAERVLVSNGVYDTGGRVDNEGLTNRVYIGQILRLESVNGPEHTIIKGQAGSGEGGFGPDAVRGIYATTQCWISGFTIYGGHTHTMVLFYCWNEWGPVQAGCRVTKAAPSNGGAIWCVNSNVIVSNCFFIQNRAYGSGGAVRGGTLHASRFIRNHAEGKALQDYGQGGACFLSDVSDSYFCENDAKYGGGSALGTVSNCIFVRNTATLHGGAFAGCRAEKCDIRENSAPRSGAVSQGCKLSFYTYGGGTYTWGIPSECKYCMIESNRAVSVAGASCSDFEYCTFSGNTALGWYGALFDCTARNTLFLRNKALHLPLGTYGRVENCCIIENALSSAPNEDDYSWRSYMYVINCIVVSNYCPIIQLCSSTFYCQKDCIIPGLPGAGNIDADPEFVDYEGGDFRLASNSPCINRGTNLPWMAGATDMEGNPRILCGCVDMGAYESPYWGMYSDVDGDGMSDFSEYYTAGTDPADADSVLRLLGEPHWVRRTDADGMVISWSSQTGRWYMVYRTTNLFEGNFTIVGKNIRGVQGMTSITDRTAHSHSTAFYRVKVMGRESGRPHGR